MAQQNWFYKTDGNQHGPVSGRELKRLASIGEIKADDLVRRESMEKWVRAKSVKGLIKPKDVDGPPPLPKKNREPEPEATGEEVSRSLVEKLKSSASEVAEATKTAGVVAARQAELTRINTVDLPRLYSKLGEWIRREGAFPEDFPEVHERIDLIEQSLDANKEAVNSTSNEESVSGKTKTLARLAKLKAEEGTLRIQRSKALRELGESAFQKCGIEAGEPSLVSEIKSLLHRASEISDEIESLENSATSSFLRPKRMALVGVFALGLMFLYAATSFLSSNSGASATSSKLREGIANYAALVSDQQQGQSIDSHIGKTVVVSGSTFAKGPRDFGSEISIECPDGTVAMCRFAAKDAWKGDQKQFSIVGTFSEVFLRGQLILTDCEIVDLSTLDAEPESKVSIDGASELAVRVGTPLETPWWIEKKYNPSIQNAKAYKTETSIILDFDVDTTLWMEADWLIPLVVNLYDKEGAFLARFETDDRFTVFRAVHTKRRQDYDTAIRIGAGEKAAAQHNSSLLKSSGNRFEYNVNGRVLHNAAVVQIGFYQPRG